MTSDLALRALRRVFRTRLARFAAVGLSGVAVNLGALGLLAGVLRVGEVLASGLAIEASIVWSFLLNNAITYRDRNLYARAEVGGRLLRYHAVSLVGLALQLGTFVALRRVAMGALRWGDLGGWRYLAEGAGMALGTAWNYLAHLHVTWRQGPEAQRAVARGPLVPRAAQG